MANSHDLLAENPFLENEPQVSSELADLAKSNIPGPSAQPTGGVSFNILNDGVPIQISWTAANSTNALVTGVLKYGVHCPSSPGN